MEAWRQDRSRRTARNATSGAHPSRKTRQKKRAEGKPIFVIQKHAARQTHYDFRLQVERTLKSWQTRRAAFQHEKHFSATEPKIQPSKDLRRSAASLKAARKRLDAVIEKSAEKVKH
jgi:hypothetical protein